MATAKRTPTWWRSNRPARRFRPRAVQLEGRTNPSFVFIDFGDNFPVSGSSRNLNTSCGAMRNVADSTNANDKILGVGLSDANGNYSDATALRVTRQPYTAAERAEMLAVVRRAYRPLNVTPVELTSSSVTLSDGRTVAAAHGMSDVVATLRGGAAASRDAYIFAAVFTVAPGTANAKVYNNGGGLSPEGTTLGVSPDLDTAVNSHDDVALVFAAGVGGDFSTTTNNIVHESGHCLGLQHAMTNFATDPGVSLLHRSEVMSYLNTSASSSTAFLRYPTIRGDGNCPVTGQVPVNYNDLAARPASRQTTFNQLAADANVGASTAVTFVSGTGAHDIIHISRGLFGLGSVSVTAFPTAAYTAGTAIAVPGVGGTTFSYGIALNRPILVYAGDGDDRIVIDGDLGVSVEIDGMKGTDSLVVAGLGAASATYAPDSSTTTGPDFNLPGGPSDPIASYGGTVTVGSTTIRFEDFETASTVNIDSVSAVTETVQTLTDALRVQASGGNFLVASAVGADVDIVPLLTDAVSLTVDAGANDALFLADNVTVSLVGLSTANGGRSCQIGTGNGSDLVTVETLPLNVSLTVDAGFGDDGIVVDSNGASPNGTVNSIFGHLEVIGGPNTNTLLFEDRSDTTADTVSVTGSLVGLSGDNFFGAGGGVSYSGITTLTLNMTTATAGDSVTVTPSAATTIVVNGFAPTTQSGSGDRLIVALTGTSNPNLATTTATSGQWTFGNRMPVVFDDIEECDAFPPRVQSVVVNGGAAQRSRVTSITVAFAERVQFQNGNVAAAFQLSRLFGGPVGGFTATAAVVGGATVVTLSNFSGAETRFGSLADGRYSVRVFASAVSSAGVALDGNGDGSSGDDFVMASLVPDNLFCLFGDVNGDAVVNAADFAQMRSAFGTSVGQAAYLDFLDFNGDGVINSFDFGQMRNRFGGLVP